MVMPSFLRAWVYPATEKSSRKGCRFRVGCLPMWMRKFLPLVTMAAALGQLAFAEPELVFKKYGQAPKTFTLSEMKKLASPIDITVYEFQNEKEEPYRAIPIQAVLDHVYGPEWKKAEEILFT